MPTRTRLRRVFSWVDQFAGLVTCTVFTHMSDKIRVSLFDNRGAENPNAPILNGRLEIPVSQIQELMDYLTAQETKIYEDREFVTLPVSLWQYENQPSKLKFTGSASLYRPEAAGGAGRVHGRASH